MKILIYAPFIGRSKDTEAVLQKFKEEGHVVLFLNLCSSEYLSERFSTMDIPYYETRVPVGNKRGIIQNVFFLNRFCKRHKIDVVISHLDPAHTVAVVSQYFIKAKVVLVRHHADDVYLSGLHNNIIYRGTYRLARQVIVVSEFARQVMIRLEKIAAHKIDVIPLSYNLKDLEQPCHETVKNLEKDFPALLKILVVGRMVKNKRMELAVEVAKRLKDNGVDFTLLFLGTGPYEGELQEMIRYKQLEDRCHFIGFRRNIVDYIEFSDILLHPSASESSSLIVKEFAFRRKPVIVCKGVGDFDEVVIDNVTGVKVDKDRFIEESVAFLLSVANDKSILHEMGKKLHQRVRDLFDVEKNIRLYDKYLH
jgi:glycosyltransferase involved in cell wall biosynthesis